MIEIKHIKKSFGNHQVLKDVSLRVETGDVVVILGPSGSGKTTFLRCINFLEKADAGEIIMKDLAVDCKKPGKRRSTRSVCAPPLCSRITAWSKT